jgi:protein-tyrosine phosphatase
LIDLHTHVLPGVDDGCRTIEESVRLARAAAAEGITALAATPHVRFDYPTEPATMERLVAEVRGAVAAAGIPIEILPGGELALDLLGELAPDAVRRFGLGGNPDVVLLEFPYAGWPLALDGIVFNLHARGKTVVLAHPERNAEVQADPDSLAELVGRGVLVQVTAASLDGRLGRSSRRAARALLDRELAHLVASDAHTPDVRSGGLRRATEAVGDAALARWLTEDMPKALVAGERPPERPPASRRRRRFGRCDDAPRR